MKLLPIPFEVILSGRIVLQMVWEIVESFQPFFLGYLTEKQDQSLSDYTWVFNV